MPDIQAPFLRVPRARALLLAAVASATFAGAALADTRIFLIDTSDGYGVDGCLSSGAPCGEQVASAWCQSHDYTRALDFGRVQHREPRNAMAASPAPEACAAGTACPVVVAITCSR